MAVRLRECFYEKFARFDFHFSQIFMNVECQTHRPVVGRFSSFFENILIFLSFSEFYIKILRY